MTLNQVVKLFVENPDRMKMGAGKLSVRYTCTREDIAKARTRAKQIIENSKNSEEIVTARTMDLPKKSMEWSNPLTPKEAFKTVERTAEALYNKPRATKVGMHIVLGCSHVPFQNRKMQQGVIDLIADLGNRVKGFHLIGDTLDMNSLSAHEPNKVPLKGITLGYEYVEGNRYLDSFEAVLPKDINKTYIYGNHEDRYRRHISDINNSKYADALMSPRQALNLDARGYLVKDNWKEDFVFLGNDLQMIHGEFCTKYPARTHVDRMKASVIFAHTHRIDINYDGEKAGFNIGWGGDTNAPAFSYVSRLTKMNWINGFALVHIDEKGNYFTQVIPVFNDEFWYNGKRYGR